MPVVRVTVDEVTYLWFDSKQWLNDIFYIGGSPRRECSMDPERVPRDLAFCGALSSMLAARLAGAQTVVGILPWVAMAFANGRVQAPHSQLRIFGAGSGLLAFAFAPQRNRLQPGEPEQLQDAAADVSPACAREPSRPPPLAATALEAAFATLFPR